MREDLEASDAPKTEFGIGEFAETIGGDGEEDLIAKGFVGLLVGAESNLVFVEDSVDFGNLGSGGGGRMDRIDRAVDGSDERNVTGSEEVGGREEGESKMPMHTIAGIGRDGGCVGVELGLSKPDGGVGGWGGDGGNGRNDGVGKRRRDGGGGEGGIFLHGGSR